eukprot:CAMPEP_0194160108 /NCGR_PEP_ID=MMETSP0152-20130528/78206_1 /TAXON_ID=1049557 /ORGANISM="Thalassiothrix antarctica, Strain L6-D1" /LENGTH=530 /DNA_ID=CAMNT_0038869761 /DNA_START=75 /DNA_END=1667 /DNA_ORIENTATION=+
MSSIPYDPTLQLGQIVDLEKIHDLQAIAALQKPLDLALEKLNNVTKTSYKLKMIYRELDNLDIGTDKLEPMVTEMQKVMNKIASCALAYGQTALTVIKAVEDLKTSQEQKTIGVSVESPLDYSASSVVQFPLAFDSMTFDVQYIRNESNDQSDSSHAKSVSAMNSNKTEGVGVKNKETTISASSTHETVTKQTSNHKIEGTIVITANCTHASSTHETVTKQTSNHKIEGTIVITANCTHKNADIIEPFRINPEKAVAAWNYTFPKDKIDTGPAKIFAAALDDHKTPPADKDALNMISGCTKGSSFVGMIHILQSEKSDSSSNASSYASSVSNKMEKDMWMNSSSGGYGNSKGFAKSLSAMNSTSNVDCHVSIQCRGMIPSIVANDLTTTVQSMDMDPETVMANLSAIQEAGNQGVNTTMESQMGEGKRGGQFISLSNEYMNTSVTNIAEKQTEANKVIDQNSMMSAFEDYVEKAQAGECGIPINFYIKRLTKNDVAKCYIRKFYPSGRVTSARDAQKAQIGQVPEAAEEE